MKFIDFDREYFDNVHKLERGSITLGEYADAGEKLLNKFGKDVINEMKDKLQLSAIYTETENGWSGMTVDTIQIEEIANELKEQKMDRDCNKCVYSTREGGCRKFKCEGTKTVEDIKTETIDAFMNKALAMIKAEQDTRYGYLDCMDIREIAKELKEQK